MVEVSVESIRYLIISETEATVQTCSCSIKTLLHGNVLVFGRNRIGVAHLNTCTLSNPTKIVLIPYSLHTIFGGGWVDLAQLKYRVSEREGELASIDRSAFRKRAATSSFIPQSVCFITFSAFAYNESVPCVHFDRNSSPIPSQ
jgi:hypothetical protein